MIPEFLTSVMTETGADEKPEANRFILWIDGVGAYLICLKPRVVLGGPRGSAESADVALLANLSRRHATLVRDRGGYHLEAHADVRIAGETVTEPVGLASNSEIQLGENVRLRFRLPSPLSASAKLEFLTDHRPANRIDGVVLMEETCLLGPGSGHHIDCADWEQSVVLYRRNNSFACRSQSELFIDGRPSRDGNLIAPGAVISGADFRLRIEPAND